MMKDYITTASINIRNKPFLYIVISLFLIITLGCAIGSSSSIITGNKRPSIDPRLVKIYLKEPRNFEVIGIVKASSSPGWTEQGAIDHAISNLKKEAARMGANGVVLSTTGTKTTPIVGGSSGVIWTAPIEEVYISGIAIYVIEE